MPFALIEPLRDLFKDEVRQIGRELGLPEEILSKHPFPGPGLAVRLLGEITREKLETLRGADVVVVEEIRHAGLYEKVWQAFAVLLPVRSVGVMGDDRTYGYTIAVRVVDSQDAMTADWSRLPSRRAGANLHPHRQRGARGQPGGLRYQLETAEHDRVGVAQKLDTTSPSLEDIANWARGWS